MINNSIALGKYITLNSCVDWPPPELKGVLEIQGIAHMVARAAGTTVAVFGVGGVADQAHVRGVCSDVDLLIAFRKPNLRQQCTNEMRYQLRNGGSFTQLRSNYGSCPVLDRDTTYAGPNMHVVPWFGESQKPRSSIDVSFLGKGAGSIRRERRFHKKHKLAYCKLIR